MDESKDRAPRQGWTGSGNRMRYKGDLYGFRHSPKFLCSTFTLVSSHPFRWSLLRITACEHPSLLKASALSFLMPILLRFMAEALGWGISK